MNWLEFWAMLKSIEYIVGTVIAIVILTIFLWSVWQETKEDTHRRRK
jgi:uncharacterized membrane protein